MKLYHFNPNERGLSYVLVANHPQGAKIALIEYLNKKLELAKHHENELTAKHFTNYYEYQLKKWQTAFDNNKLPNDYILEEIDDHVVLEFDNVD